MPSPRPENFLGRQRELDVARQVASATSPIGAVFYGPPGSGRTTLLKAIEFDSRVALKFGDLVYARVGGMSWEDFGSTLFSIFHVISRPPFYPTTHEWMEEELRLKRIALLLDDVDPFFDFDALFRTLPNATLYATANAPINNKLLRSFEISPLSPEDSMTLLESSVKIFPHEREVAVNLCAAVKGIPAKIDQIGAIARLTKRSLVDVNAMLSSRGIEDALERRVGLLEPELKRMFDAVSLFEGIAADAEDKTALELESRKLIARDPERGWRLVTGLAQRYTVSNADDLVFANAVNVLGPDIGQRLGNAAQPAQLLNVVDVARRGVELGHFQDALRLGMAASDALAACGAWRQWAFTVDFVLQLAREQRDNVTIAWALHQGGTRHACLDEMAAAEQLLRESLAIRKSTSDAAGKAVTRHNLGVITHRSFNLGWIAAAAALVVAVLGGAYFLITRTVQQAPMANNPPAIAAHVAAHRTQVRARGTRNVALNPKPRSPSQTAASILAANSAQSSIVPLPATLPGTNSQGPGAHPQIVAFRVEHSLLIAGQSGNMCIAVRNASHVRLTASNGSAPAVPESVTHGSLGCFRIAPSRSTRYTLVAEGGDKTVQQDLAVDVFEPLGAAHHPVGEATPQG